MKTIRLYLPQWQGGNNPDYVFGAKLLRTIVPNNPTIETVSVPINLDFNTPLKVTNGIEGEEILIKQMTTTKKILETKNPDRIIVLGGDCSVSQVPFDYLSQKYQDKLGILWLDAHPDVATVESSSRLHEMVLNNLITGHNSSPATTTKNPVAVNRVMLAGLVYEEIREKDQIVNSKNIPYATSEQLLTNSDIITDWIKKENIQYLAVHFDLDVLSPEDFRSIYPAEPYLESFGAAIGKLTLNQVAQIFKDVSKYSKIVGLTIAEHMPWDAMRLNQMLSKITIFND